MEQGVAQYPAIPAENLWLAKALWDLGAVSFGDFNVGRTVGSPVYVNPRLLISKPALLRRVATVMERELLARQNKRRPECQPFTLVAGVPYGGLHLATAFSLRTKMPMVYVRHQADRKKKVIEGLFDPGERALIVDDLITSGSSVLDAARALRSHDLVVSDALVLVDRDQGGSQRLQREGINLISLLRLPVMLNYYMTQRWITEDW
jgi:orotate phosphoribosyltransferase/uridine monophosphate synthetase